MRYFPYIMGIVLLYLGLSPHLQISSLLTGGVIAVGITLLVRPPCRRKSWRRMPSSLMALVAYVAILAWDLIKSGFQVAGIVLAPNLPLNPGTIAIPSESHSEMDKALSAHAITLTPGEVVVEMDDQGVMYTHCLDMKYTEKYIGDAQRMRIKLLQRIFE